MIKSLEINKGGEIFVPKLRTFKVTELAKAIKRNCEIREVGIRPGEKLHEELISKSDVYHTIENKNMYVVLDPANNTSFNLKKLFTIYKNQT